LKVSRSSNEPELHTSAGGFYVHPTGIGEKGRCRRVGLLRGTKQGNGTGAEWDEQRATMCNTPREKGMLRVLLTHIVSFEVTIVGRAPLQLKNKKRLENREGATEGVSRIFRREANLAEST